jgi:hypothetical protein
MSFKLPLIIVLVVLAGCSATGPIYVRPDTPPQDYARIVFYRETGVGGAAWPHHYYIDRTLVAKLRVGGYTTLLVKPGPRLVHTGGTPEYNGLLIEIPLKPGQTYYFLEGRSFDGVTLNNIYGTDRFGLMPADEAEKVIKTYRYQKPLVEIFDGKI